MQELSLKVAVTHLKDISHSEMATLKTDLESLESQKGTEILAHDEPCAPSSKEGLFFTKF